MALITYEQAKEHLRIGDEEADDLNLKIDLATAMVLKHAKQEDHEWDVDTTDPAEDLDFAIVQAAILEVLTNIYAERGDGNVKDGPITARVVNILAPMRDPTLA